MARIRSIHPGLFTDEAFMSASPYARLLMMGIWCEAWDDGVFELKPLTLKARIFPVDNVNVVELLDELEKLKFITHFTAQGKHYGVVRNFQKYQRPKKPNSSGVLPAELRSYVGIADDSSEPVEDQFPTGGEKSPQMEDGGWREGEEGSEPNGSGALAPIPPPSSRELLFLEGKPALIAMGVSERQSGSILGRWLRDAGDDAERVLAAVQRARDQCPMDPIPWITASLKPENANGPRHRKHEIAVAFDSVDERLASLGIG